LAEVNSFLMPYGGFS